MDGHLASGCATKKMSFFSPSNHQLPVDPQRGAEPLGAFSSHDRMGGPNGGQVIIPAVSSGVQRSKRAQERNFHKCLPLPPFPALILAHLL